MPLVENQSSHDRSGLRDFWIGTREFNCPYAERPYSEEFLENDSWFIRGVELLPVKMRVLARDLSVPGNARIIVSYQSELNPDKYDIDSATLTIRGLPREARAQYDLDGEPIETEPDENGYFYKPVKGSNIVLKTRSLVIVNTAYELSGLNWPLIDSFLDCVNMYSWPNMGNAQPGTMRLVNAIIPKFFLVGPRTTIVPFQYHFWWDRRGWNNLLEAQRFRRWPKQFPVLSRNDQPEDEGLIDGEGGRVYVDKDTGEDTEVFDDALKRVAIITEPAGVPEPRRLLEIKDMSSLRGYMHWVA